MTLETGWLPSTPPHDNLFRKFLLNQAEANEIIALASGGRSTRDDDVAIADAGGIVPYFNQAVLLRPVLDAADPVLDRVESFFAECPSAMMLSIWPTPDLTSRGWSLIGHPGFVARPALPIDHTPPTDVHVTVATTAAQLATCERIAIEGYPLDDAKDLPAGAVLAPGIVSTDVRYRAGLLDDDPVAAAASYVGQGVTNLCFAATLPAARRRGVWESLVWARLADAPTLPAVAFTSDFSRPGFERMGFLMITRFTLWWRGAH